MRYYMFSGAFLFFCKARRMVKMLGVAEQRWHVQLLQMNCSSNIRVLNNTYNCTLRALVDITKNKKLLFRLFVVVCVCVCLRFIRHWSLQTATRTPSRRSRSSRAHLR